MYIRIYQNINITKKTCCVSPNIVPTDSPSRVVKLVRLVRLASEAHQGTQQLKKAILVTLKQIK